MAISETQVEDVKKLRTEVHTLINKGVTDEYLLATYNGILRRLDDRLPRIRQRAEGKSLKEESRALVKQQREGLKKKGAGSTSLPSGNSKKTS